MAPKTSTIKLRCMSEHVRTLDTSLSRVQMLYRAETSDDSDLLQITLRQLRQSISNLDNIINNRLQERAHEGEDTF